MSGPPQRRRPSPFSGKAIVRPASPEVERAAAVADEKPAPTSAGERPEPAGAQRHATVPPERRPSTGRDQPRMGPRRDERTKSARDPRPPQRRDVRAPAPSAPSAPSAPAAVDPRANRRDVELRVFGINACHAVFAHRPDAIRKVYLTQQRVSEFRVELAWLAAQRIGYRIVPDTDLEKLTQSQHHEGVCFEILRAPPQPLPEFLAALRGRQEASLLILLDGVGNPHNFGAVLRIAAHFGAHAVLLTPGSTLSLSGAACRVAEGGAEAVPLVATGDLGAGLEGLVRAGYVLAATVVREGIDPYAQPLPRKLVLMLGAEGGGLSPALLARAQLKLRIPGTGAVESLNIAAATAVLCAEFWRQSRDAAEASPPVRAKPRL